jgi:hypothetical protein
MEMSKEQLAQRMLCAQANIDAQNMRRGFLSQEEWHKLTRAVGPLSDSPLYIDDAASLSVMEIRAKARRLKAEKGLEVVFVDYLQLMRGFSRAESRQQELSEISRSLKALAKELKIPVIALSQLSRAVEKRPDRRPMLSDLMESGGIEANADMVLFIYRESYYTKDADKGNVAEVIISNNETARWERSSYIFWTGLISLPISLRKTGKKRGTPAVQSKYDVVIIGAGPAGIFTALELGRNSQSSILIVEKGASLEKTALRHPGRVRPLPALCSLRHYLRLGRRGRFQRWQTDPHS